MKAHGQCNCGTEPKKKEFMRVELASPLMSCYMNYISLNFLYNSTFIDTHEKCQKKKNKTLIAWEVNQNC